MRASVVEGQILAGKYRVERVIGQGGMGVVVAATHVELQKLVAVKLLAGNATRGAVKRFLREARSAGRLRGEHIARVLDAGALETGAPFIVFEYLEGEDLARAIQQREPLAIAEAVDYVVQVSEAIAEAHHLGIIHRDLKPSNLFVATAADGTRSIKVLDFGISKLVEPAGAEIQTAITQSDETLGSPLYMAPEQMKSAREADARADIWSMGVILYQLVTARLPFEASSLHELAMMMIHDERPLPPRSHRPDLPEPIEAAILRCLEKDRCLRFASIGELAEAIAPHGSEEAVRSVAKIQRLVARPLCSGVGAGAFDEAAPSSRDGASGDAPLCESESLRSPLSGTGAIARTRWSRERDESAGHAALSGPTSQTWTAKAWTMVVSRRLPRRRVAVVAAVGATAALATALGARLWRQESTPAPLPAGAASLRPVLEPLRLLQAAPPPPVAIPLASAFVAPSSPSFAPSVRPVATVSPAAPTGMKPE